MKNSYFIVAIICNLVISICFVATFDNKITISYAQQLDTNVTQTLLNFNFFTKRYRIIKTSTFYKYNYKINIKYNLSSKMATIFSHDYVN